MLCIHSSTDGCLGTFHFFGSYNPLFLQFFLPGSRCGFRSSSASSHEASHAGPLRWALFSPPWCREGRGWALGFGSAFRLGADVKPCQATVRPCRALPSAPGTATAPSASAPECLPCHGGRGQGLGESPLSSGATEAGGRLILQQSPAFPDAQALPGAAPPPPLCTEAMPRLAYAHAQLGYIFEAVSYAPNWIKTKARRCGFNFQRLGMSILGVGFHETSVCTVAETLPR